MLRREASSIYAFVLAFPCLCTIGVAHSAPTVRHPFQTRADLFNGSGTTLHEKVTQSDFLLRESKKTGQSPDPQDKDRGLCR
jgi:hypothetical protein